MNHWKERKRGRQLEKFCVLPLLQTIPSSSRRSPMCKFTFAKFISIKEMGRRWGMRRKEKFNRMIASQFLSSAEFCLLRITRNVQKHIQATRSSKIFQPNPFPYLLLLCLKSENNISPLPLIFDIISHLSPVLEDACLLPVYLLAWGRILGRPWKGLWNSNGVMTKTFIIPHEMKMKQ